VIGTTHATGSGALLPSVALAGSDVTRPAAGLEKRFRRLVEGARDIVYDCDVNGHFTYVNPAATRVLRYEERDLLGRHHLALVRSDYRDRAAGLYQQQLTERIADTYLEFPTITKTGQTLWLGQHVQLVYDGENVIGFQAIARDITVQQNLEMLLRKSEEWYRSVIQNASYGISRTTADGTFLDVNPALAKMLGYGSPEEVLELGKVTAIYADPQARARFVDECRRTGRVDNFEVECRRKDRSLLTVRLSARAFRNEHGVGAGYEVILDDVTQQRRLEDHLRQAQKMEAVGQLAGGIAHNFNNLLTAILGYTELLLDRQDDSARDDLEEIRRAGTRASDLTRQLLAFSRKQPPSPKDLDLNETVSSLQNMLKRLIREDIVLSCQLAAEPAFIHIDPTQIEQVIINLVVNARDAQPNGGYIRLEVAAVSVSDAESAMEKDLPPAGKYVRLRVADGGVGMTPEVRAHLFEPFFTTKEPGKGTGLGLASVYGLVQDSQGFIAVESEVGRGSTFTLHFPQTTPPRLEPVKSAVVPAATPGPRETILIVEDEDSVRAVTSAVLRREGYQVIEAATPRLALELFEKHADEIDLLLSDVVMPEMNGPALAQRLVALRPGLRIVFMSGYAAPGLLPGAENANVGFLNKPFPKAVLVQKVGEMLGTIAPESAHTKELS
jgi:PAS domain S-box-containing protein